MSGRLVSSLSLCLAVGGCYDGLETGRGSIVSGAPVGPSEDPTGGGTGAQGEPMPWPTSGRPGEGGDRGETDGGDPFDGEGLPDEPAGDADGEDASGPFLASGISLVSVEVNQGVAINLVDNGEVVPASGRNANLVSGRAALVRGFWELHQDFVPRELEGRLIVTQSNGTSETFTDVREIGGPPDPTQLEGGFLWDVPEGVLTADATFAVEIRELDGVPKGPGALTRARVPAEGDASLQTANGEHRLEVVIVPLRFSSGGSVRVPDLSASNKKLIEDRIYDANPVEEVVVSYHSPVNYSAPIRNTEEFGDVLGFLSSLRSSEGARSNVYYAGLIETGCFSIGCGNIGTTGIGYVAGGAGSGALRVSATVWFDPESSAETLVHEIGHNQGLSHIGCPGGIESEGNDPSYPHAQGRIGVWGYGPRSGEVIGSSAYDYMSYCGPSWVSDWTWEKTRARISSLSASSAADSAASNDAELLAGIVYADGNETWFSVKGSLDAKMPRSGRQAVAFSRGSRGTQTRAVVSGDIPDLNARWVLVEMPDDVRSAEWIDAGVRRPIDLSALDRFERMRASTNP